MQKFLLIILPYPLFILLIVLLIVGRSQNLAVSPEERRTLNNKAILTSKISLAEREQAKVKTIHLLGGYGSLERAIEVADKHALQRFTNQLPKKYANNFPALVRVYLSLAKGWEKQGDLPRMQTALKNAGTALDEVRSQYLVMEMKCLSGLANVESLLGNSENTSKVRHRVARLLLEREPCLKSRHWGTIEEYHAEAVQNLIAGAPSELWHKVYASSHSIPHHHRSQEENEYFIRVQKELERPDSAYNKGEHLFDKKIRSELEKIVKTHNLEDDLHKHAKAILEFLAH